MTKINAKCILCNNKNLLELQKLKTKLLISLFKKKFDVDATASLGSHKVITYCRCTQCGLGFFLPITTCSPKFYEDLQKFDWYYQEHKSEYDYCSKFTNNKSILEIGCGAGFFFKYANASSYIGLEFNQQAVDLCLDKGINVEQKSIYEFSTCHPDEYDIVCSFQVLEHMKDPIKFVKDAIYTLKQHGILLLSVPSEDSFISLAKNNILNMPPHHVSRWPNSSFQYIAEELNITLLDTHHDKLEEIHHGWYSSVIGRQIIDAWSYRTSPKIFDTTIFDHLAGKFGSLLGLLLKNTITKNFLLPKGHTVTAVFAKH